MDRRNNHLRHVPGFWYLASPYSEYPEGKEAAFQTILRITARLMNAGIPVLSPIAHSHPISMTGLVDNDHGKTWLDWDERYMRVSHGMLVAMMDGWQTSTGVQWEIEWMAKAKKPVYFIDPRTYGETS